MSVKVTVRKLKIVRLNKKLGQLHTLYDKHVLQRITNSSCLYVCKTCGSWVRWRTEYSPVEVRDFLPRFSCLKLNKVFGVMAESVRWSLLAYLLSAECSAVERLEIDQYIREALATYSAKFMGGKACLVLE